MRLSDFAGDWRLEREIDDRLAAQTGRLSGTARFVAVPGGLAYEEAGTLRLGGAAPVHATQRHLWREGGGARIEVLFADGRPFHAFATDRTQPEAAHACPPDHYRVNYAFGDWPAWRAHWRVRGPHKDYALVSTYRRAGQAGADAASPVGRVPDLEG